MLTVKNAQIVNIKNLILMANLSSIQHLGIVINIEQIELKL